MEQVPVPGVVDGEQQTEDPVAIATAAGDVVGEGRRVAGAAADVGEGGGTGEEDGGGGEADGSVEENEKGDEGRSAQGEYPSLGRHEILPAWNAIRARTNAGARV